MSYHPEGYGVEVQVAFTDRDEQPVVPTSISAQLFDGYDTLLNDFGSMPFEIADGAKTIFIPAAFNHVDDGEVRSARLLRVTMEVEDATGPIIKTLSYVVETEQSLMVMVNTFQSYEAACLLVMEMANANGWNAATPERRRAALAEAFRRLTSIPMRYGIRDEEGYLDPDDLSYIPREMWGEVSAEDYNGFPLHFRRSLRRAQLIEANELLEGEVIAARHRAGIVTEKIGESMVTLRGGRLDYGVNSQTLNALTGYIHYDLRIARA